MFREVLAVAGGAAILVVGLSGCSSDKKSEGASSATATPTVSATASASAGGVSAAAGSGTATVTIDGQPKDIQGQVVCATSGGNVNIAIGQAATGIAVIMAEDATTVTSVGLGNINGVALGFQDGAPGGNASATKDGKTYTISGTASGVDMANPMQPITKPFEIAVTCP
jgi:lipoprotein LpqH